MTIIDSSASTIDLAGVPSMIGVPDGILSGGILHHLDSSHTMNARPPATIMPNQLTHSGTTPP